MMNKYRVHEVAKDFKLNSKDIAEIMTKYSQTPKNQMCIRDRRGERCGGTWVTKEKKKHGWKTVGNLY